MHSVIGIETIMATNLTTTRPNIRKNPKNNFPTWFIFLLNGVIVGLVAYGLNNKVVFPCVTPPYISSLSAALTLVVFVHFSWRYLRKAIRRTRSGKHTITFTAGGVKFEFDRNVIIAFFNEIQPWKLPSSLLGIFLFVSFIAGLFLNISPYSPFRERDQPFSIQGFSVQRSSPLSQEQLAPGETLAMTAGEDVIVEVVLLGDAQVSCSWSILSRGDNAETGCSIAYSALTSGIDDILSVFVQPACGSIKKSGSLFIAIQP